MKFLSKSTLLTAVAATVIAASTPALAHDGRYRGRDGIDAGDVIAGALIIGGIAAIASAGSRGGWGHDRYYDSRRYDRDDYGYYRNGYGSRRAVEQCVRAAQRDASRYGRARVTDITSISRTYGGYEVRGRLIVASRYYRGWDHDRWDRYGYDYDRYGDDYDKGRFSCSTRYGDIEDLRFYGLRG